jgi:hypothetical protein
VNFDHFPLDGGLNYIMNPLILIKYHPDVVASIIRSSSPYVVLETEVPNPGLSGYGLEDLPERRFSEEERDLYRSFYKTCGSVALRLSPVPRKSQTLARKEI